MLFNLFRAPKISLSSLPERSMFKSNSHLSSTGSMAGASSKQIALGPDTYAGFGYAVAMAGLLADSP